MLSEVRVIQKQRRETFKGTMADFDAIYEDQADEVASILEGPDIQLVPDPIIIRGAGNITV